MSQLFTPNWIAALATIWNQDSAMLGDLHSAEFTAKVSFGFRNEDNPRIMFVVDKGHIIRYGLYTNEELDWDLRASEDDWLHWLKEGFGLSKLGVAISSEKLMFKQGDYRKMMRNQNLSRPFMRVFELMQQVKTK